jgi:SAM-dependent methyltransferase
MPGTTPKLSHYVVKSLYQVLSWYYSNKGAPTSQTVLKLFELWKNLHAMFMNISEEGWAVLEKLAKELGLIVGGKEGKWLFLYSLETYLNIVIRAMALSKLGAAPRDIDSFKKAIQQRRNIFDRNVFEWIFDALACNYLPNDHQSSLQSSLNTLLGVLYNLNLLHVSFDDFREVYQNILPREIRRSLGEFYTNEDLVRRVLDAAGLDPGAMRALYNEWKQAREHGRPATTIVLDPACGSGSFLIEVVRRIFNSFDRLPPDITEFIEECVQGIDINPFAAEMAKMNIIITTASEMVKSGGIYTPRKVRVYWADSLAKIKKENHIHYDVLRIHIPILQRLTGMEDASIDIPIIYNGVVPLQVFEATCECIANNTDACSFKNHVIERFYGQISSEELDLIKPILEKLYNILLDIHRKGNSRIVDLIRGVVAIQSLVGRCRYVIGNPPWVRTRNLTREVRNYLRENYEWLSPGSAYDPEFKKTKTPFKEQFDYSVAFVERGLEFLAEGGALSYVITSKILKALYAGQMRKDLVEKYTVLELVDYSLYPVQLFRDAVNYPLVISVKKSPPPQSHKVKVTVYNTGGKARSFELEQSMLPLFAKTNANSKNTDRSPWVLAPPEVISVLKKAVNSGERLGDIYEVMMGVKTSLNKIYIGKINGNNASKGTVTLQLENGTTVEVEEFLVHPVVRGEDIDPFSYSWSEYIIFPHDVSTFEPLWDSNQRKVLEIFNLISSRSSVQASGSILKYQIDVQNINAFIKNAIQLLKINGYNVIQIQPCNLNWCLRVVDPNGNHILHVSIEIRQQDTAEFQVADLKIPSAPMATRHFTKYFKELLRRDDYKASLPPWAVFRVNEEKFKEYRIAWQEIAKCTEAAHLPVFTNGRKLLVPLQKVYFIVENDILKALKILIYLNTDFVRSIVKLWAWSTRGGYYEHTSYAMGLLPVPAALKNSSIWNKISSYLTKPPGDLNGIARKAIEELKEEFLEELLGAVEMSKEEYSRLVEYGRWLNELEAQPAVGFEEEEEEALEE